ncbi:MAG: TolC family protein [Acidobacteriia bacterium]|nr:TolC family protein [Terriglobia bacterium]
MKWNRNRGFLFVLALLGVLTICITPASLRAQQPSEATRSFNYENGTSMIKAYSYPQVRPQSLANSTKLRDLIQNGKLMLSVEDAVELALENNLDIGVARYQLPLAQLDVLRANSGGAARGIQGAFVSNALFAGAIGAGISGFTGGSGVSAGGFSGGGGAINAGFVGCCDPVTGFSAGWNSASSPLNFTELVGIPVEGTHTSTYATFLGKGFVTGTSMSVAISGERQSSTSVNSLFNPAVPMQMTIGLNQHLLKGFGRRANAVFIRIAKNDLHVADSVFRQQVMTTLGQVLNAYYTLLADRDQVRVGEAAVSYSQKLVNDDKIQAQIGTLARLDVVQAESELATDQQNLIVAQTTYLQQAETLKTMLSKRVGADLANIPIETTDNLPDPEPGDQPPLEQALELAYKSRPEVEQADLNLRNQDYTIQSNRSGLLPTLDAFATYAPAGLSGIRVLRNQQGQVVGTVPGGFTDSFGNLFSGAYPNYSAGVTLSIPLRNRAQQANAAQALVERHQMEMSLQRQKNQIAQDVRNAEIAVTQAKAQIDAAIKAREYAQEALDAERKKLQVGASTTLNVILLQRGLVTAQGNEAKAHQAYAQAIVQLQQAMGTILDAHRVTLADAKSGQYSRVPNIPGTPASSNP